MGKKLSLEDKTAKKKCFTKLNEGLRIYKTVIESRQLLPLGREDIVQKVQLLCTTWFSSEQSLYINNARSINKLC